MIALILWALGLFMIYLEFYLPGAVMAIGGGILLVMSVIFLAMETGSPLLTILYFLCVAISIGFLIKYAMRHISKQKPERSVYSDAYQEGYVASKFDKSTIGKQGIVLSDLKPGGYILIEGKQHQALSLSGYITKGTDVIVIGGQEESLLVKPIKKEKST